MRILLVEDDFLLAESLADALMDEKYHVQVAQDGESAWHYLSRSPFDIALLDLQLPGVDGIRFCQKIRAQGYHLPIVMLTARDTSIDKITGLDAGADDYVVKPFHLQELLARIRAHLRRSHQPEERVLQWERLWFNTSTCEVTYEGQPVKLTAKELGLLRLLMSRGRQVLSRRAILEALWQGEDPPEEETIKSHIRTLRHKLAKAGSPDLIETVYGLGYRLGQVGVDQIS